MRKPSRVTTRARGKSRSAAMSRRRLLPAVRPTSMASPKTAAAAAADAFDKPTTCSRNSGAQSKMQNSMATAMTSAHQQAQYRAGKRVRPEAEVAAGSESDARPTKGRSFRQRPRREARHCASPKRARDTGSLLEAPQCHRRRQQR